MPDHNPTASEPHTPHGPHDALKTQRERLLSVLGRSHQERSFTDPTIRQAAREYGRAARSIGLPPERLVISLKELMRSPDLAQLGDWFRRVITDRVIVWSIDSYYGLESD